MLPRQQLRSQHLLQQDQLVSLVLQHQVPEHLLVLQAEAPQAGPDDHELLEILCYSILLLYSCLNCISYIDVIGENA